MTTRNQLELKQLLLSLLPGLDGSTCKIHKYPIQEFFLSPATRQVKFAAPVNRSPNKVHGEVGQ